MTQPAERSLLARRRQPTSALATATHPVDDSYRMLTQLSVTMWTALKSVVLKIQIRSHAHTCGSAGTPVNAFLKHFFHLWVSYWSTATLPFPWQHPVHCFYIHSTVVTFEFVTFLSMFITILVPPTLIHLLSYWRSGPMGAKTSTAAESGAVSTFVCSSDPLNQSSIRPTGTHKGQSVFQPNVNHRVLTSQTDFSNRVHHSQTLINTHFTFADRSKWSKTNSFNITGELKIC